MPFMLRTIQYFNSFLNRKLFFISFCFAFSFHALTKMEFLICINQAFSKKALTLILAASKFQWVLTALSTSSVHIDLLHPGSYNVPNGIWEVERGPYNAVTVCAFSEKAVLKGCTDHHAERFNVYWLGGGTTFQSKEIDALQEDSKKCL